MRMKALPRGFTRLWKLAGASWQSHRQKLRSGTRRWCCGHVAGTRRW